MLQDFPKEGVTCGVPFGSPDFSGFWFLGFWGPPIREPTISLLIVGVQNDCGNIR